MVQVAPFGSWSSPLSAAFVAAAGDEPQWVGLHDGEAWWVECRPAEGGRAALLRTVDGRPVEVLPAPWDVRNRVHEYGGRPWTVLGTLVVFTHWDDQRVYTVDLADGGDPVPITAHPAVEHGHRYADLGPAAGGGAVWCVRETATGAGPTEVERALVSVPLDGGEVRVLAASHRFMSGPKPSPDGRHAAWIGWNHPDMPWDAAELCVAPVTGDGAPGPHRVVAGGPGESVCQFEWDGGDALLALTDPDGWWNLHRIGLDGARVNLAPVSRELGGPLWMLGRRWFAPLGGGRHLVLDAGRPAVLDECDGVLTHLPDRAGRWSTDLAGERGAVVGVAAGPDQPAAVVRLDPTGRVRRAAPGPDLPDRRYFPEPCERTFSGPDGREVPAVVYPPRNPDFVAPDGELPPYVVHAHGGPTWHFQPLLNPAISHLTSRGIGVVAVNYGGSAGFGRAYRETLRGRWGVVDVADCAAVAQALVSEGVADPQRIGIRGGSAGGWTAAASVTSLDTYACATIMFPLLDVTPWVDGTPATHDFESRYVEQLIGRLPEHRQRYASRSPLANSGRLSCPILLLHGLEDAVCPAEQAGRLAAQLDGSGVPHAFLAFAGEQHGFRRAETIEAAITAELSFYGQVFGFATPGVPTLDLRR